MIFRFLFKCVFLIGLMIPNDTKCQAIIKKACPNHPFQLVVSEGIDLQWQAASADSGVFRNLEESSLITGVKTNTLLVASPESKDFVYRCMFKNQNTVAYSDTFLVQPVYTFNGSNDSNYYNSSNWDCDVLPYNSNAHIRIKAGKMVVDGMSLELNKLEIDEGAAIEIVNGASLLVKGSDSKPVRTKESIIILEEEEYTLLSDSTELEAGLYKFSYNGSFPIFSVGQVISGVQKNGFLKRITSVLYGSTDNVTFQTEDVSLIDVLETGKLSFDVQPYEFNELSSSKKAAVESSSTSPFVNFNNTKLIEGEALDITLLNGYLGVTNDWNFEYEFENYIPKKLSLTSKNLGFQAYAKFSVAASSKVPLLNRQGVLKTFYANKIISIPILVMGIPKMLKIPVVIETEIWWKVKAEVKTGIASNVEINLDRSVQTGISYENNNWTSYFDVSKAKVPVTVSYPAIQNDGAVEIELFPAITFYLSGLIGPQFTLGLKNKTEMESRLNPNLVWSLSNKTSITSSYGGKISFGNFLGIPSALSVNFPEVDLYEYKRPDKIIKFEGDKQNGLPNKYLSAPIKVRAFDSEDNGAESVSFFFEPRDSSGSVDHPVVVSNSVGIAETKWKLGQKKEQSLRVFALDGREKIIFDSLFTASTYGCEPVDTIIYDIDSNIYNVIKIGDQYWLKQDLKTTRYQNGDLILTNLTGEQWSDPNLTTGAFAISPSKGKHLYNWFATVDQRGLCPQGWHVPGPLEFETLENYLGGSAYAGKKLKSSTGWSSNPSSSYNGTDEVCFSAMPGGWREPVFGGFINTTCCTSFWTTGTAPGSPTLGYNKVITEEYDNVGTGYFNKKEGLSVRCLSNSPLPNQ